MTPATILAALGVLLQPLNTACAVEANDSAYGKPQWEEAQIGLMAKLNATIFTRPDSPCVDLVRMSGVPHLRQAEAKHCQNAEMGLMAITVDQVRLDPHRIRVCDADHCWIDDLQCQGGGAADSWVESWVEK